MQKSAVFHLISKHLLNLNSFVFFYELSTSFRNIDKNESTFLLPGRKIGHEHSSYRYSPERYINSGTSTQFAFSPVTEQHVYRLR